MLVCIGNSMTWETKKMVNWKVVYHGLSMIWINLNIIAEDPKKSLGKAHAGTWLIILIDSAAHRAPCVVDGTYLKDPQGSSKFVTKDAGCLESLDPVLPVRNVGHGTPKSELWTIHPRKLTCWTQKWWFASDVCLFSNRWFSVSTAVKVQGSSE